MKYLLSLMIVTGGLSLSSAQSFENMDELLQLSEMDALAFEKTVTAKAFKFISTDGLLNKYATRTEGLEYKISPRVVSYIFEERIFSLEATSRLLKLGFVLAATEGAYVLSGKTTKAQKYVKDKFTVWLYMDNTGTVPDYYIQINNDRPLDISKGSNKKNFQYKGEKPPASFAFWYVGLMIPSGPLTVDAEWATPTAHPFTGNTGIGLKKGLEAGIGGIAGLHGLNKKLPHAIDFGIMLNAQVNTIGYSLKSLGEPYSSYRYKNFTKFGAGIGPSVTITPMLGKDFHISFFYKFDALGSTGGNFEDNSSDEYKTETLERDAPNFLLVQSYGLLLHGKRFLFATEIVKYVDNGSFTWTKTTIDPVTFKPKQLDTKFNANLPFSLISLKIAMVFQD